jgi:hypothetical protein
MPDSTVTIVGNVTRDPEIRYTAGGAAKASFSVAVSRRWQNRQTRVRSRPASSTSCVARCRERRRVDGKGTVPSSPAARAAQMGDRGG